MIKTRLVLVGGFLGAGKTTLLRMAAQRLAAQGKRVGLITNDQAPDLVDTAVLSGQGASVREVAGSCFCCNFPGFFGAVESLRQDARADVILAEPVGSCTDLSATILQPIKDKYADRISLAPGSVLVDPQRVRELFAGAPRTLHDSAAYIVGKQMEEADVIVINKSDTLSGKQRAEITALLERQYPGVAIHCLSALTGEGVEDWLAHVLAGEKAGSRVVSVDYDIYAAGEAVLGWLNAAVSLEAQYGEPAWEPVLADLAHGLMVGFSEQSTRIGHVKVLLQSGGGHWLANLTRAAGPVAFERRPVDASPLAELVINARVEMSPQELEGIVRQQLEAICRRHGLEARRVKLRSLMPGRPEPTYRYDAVVG